MRPCCRRYLATLHCSNPRTPTGCDLVTWLLTPENWVFQSTHPHGVRRGQARLFRRAQGSNPRTPTGATACTSPVSSSSKVPIHAPPRGATCPTRCADCSSKVPIHAPPRGATFLLSFLRILSNVPIHAPPRGATASNPATAKYFMVPIHAPPRGATDVIMTTHRNYTFQSTHPHGVRQFFLDALTRLAYKLVFREPIGIRFCATIHTFKKGLTPAIYHVREPARGIVGASGSRYTKSTPSGS